jgi:hypothetical protein
MACACAANRALRLHHEFWPPGGARGGEHGRDRVGRGGVGRLAARARQGVEGNGRPIEQARGAAALANDGDPLERGRGATVDGREHAGKIDMAEAGLEHQHARAGDLQDVLELGSAKAGIHRHQAGAEPGQPEEEGEPFKTVDQPDRHPVARTDPLRRQPEGSASGHLRELAIGHAAVTVDDGNRVGPGDDLAREERREGGRHHPTIPALPRAGNRPPRRAGTERGPVRNGGFKQLLDLFSQYPTPAFPARPESCVYLPTGPLQH